MRRYIGIIISIIILCISVLNVSATEDNKEDIQAKKEIITQIKNSTPDEKKTSDLFVKAMDDEECIDILKEVLVDYEYIIIKQYSSGVYLLELNSVQEADEAIDLLNARDDIKFAEPNYYIDMGVQPVGNIGRPIPPSSLTGTHKVRENDIATFTLNENTYTTQEGSFSIDDDLQIAPYISDGYFMCPLRKLAEILGYNVEWISEENLIRLSRVDVYGGHMDTYIDVSTNTADMKVRQVTKRFAGRVEYDWAEVDTFEAEFEMPVKPQIVNGRTFVPLRSFAESIDFKVDWDNGNVKVSDNKDVYVTTKLTVDENYGLYAYVEITWSGNTLIEIYPDGGFDIDGDIYNTNGEIVGWISNAGPAYVERQQFLTLYPNETKTVSRSISLYDSEKNIKKFVDGEYELLIKSRYFPDARDIIHFELKGNELTIKED